ncbi:MAG TPA: DMT family transporter, partial [Chitinophagaceae bacterium]
MKSKDISLLIMLAAIWGSSYLFLRIATPVIGVMLTMSSRIIIAAVFMIIIVAFSGSMPDYRKNWKHFTVLGLLNLVIPFSLISFAVSYLNASLSAILNATTPLFTMLVSTVWLKESFNFRKLTGLLLGLAGLIVLVGWIPLEINSFTIVSIALSLLSSLCYGIAAVYARLYLKGSAPMKTAGGQLSTAALMAIPLLFFSFNPGMISVKVSVVILILAIFCTALAYALYFRLIEKVGSTNASVVTILVPVFSLLWSFLFLNEPITPAIIGGLILILGSMRMVLK